MESGVPGVCCLPGSSCDGEAGSQGRWAAELRTAVFLGGHSGGTTAAVDHEEQYTGSSKIKPRITMWHSQSTSGAIPKRTESRVQTALHTDVHSSIITTATTISHHRGLREELQMCQCLSLLTFLIVIFVSKNVLCVSTCNGVAVGFFFF
jgi:hypothetical protein